MCYNLSGGPLLVLRTVTESRVLQAHGDEVRELIAAVDKQGSGFISYDSFEAVMARSMMQQAASGQSYPDLTNTVRLQPDSSALPFHEVPRAQAHHCSWFC